MQNEKRKSVRVNTTSPCILHKRQRLLVYGTVFVGNLINLSETGCKFEVSEPLKVGSEFIMTLRFPWSTHSVTLYGDVVHTDSHRRYGARLYNRDGSPSQELACIVKFEGGRRV